MREKSKRNAEYISLIVPTVERALPPKRAWSIITEADSWSIKSTFGFWYFGNLPLINAEYVSFICRWLSAAIVSKTILDFPDPDTPVKTTIFSLGISRDTFFKLFWVNPLIVM